MAQQKTAAVEPFLPFAQPDIGEEEIAEVADTLRSGWLTSGPKVQRFEEGFREITGASQAVALASCTAGLHLALLASDIGPGDEVITTPLTFAATVNVILHTGARPVLADIREDDYCIDPEQVAAKLTERTKAIVPMHYGGLPCRMDELLSMARERGARVIEDAAHALGASYHEQPIGGLSDAAVFSFYPIKNITTGQGGMLTTNDEALAERVRLLSLHGLSKNAWNRYTEGGSAEYQVLAPGFNYAMTDIQGAIGIHQLEKLPAFQSRREEIVARYDRLLSEVPEVVLPPRREGTGHALHLYAVRVLTEGLAITRAQLIEELRTLGIGTSLHFIPIHLHPYFSEHLGLGPGDFPATERVYAGLVSLPLYPKMRDEDVERAAGAVRDVIERSRR